MGGWSGEIDYMAPVGDGYVVSVPGVRSRFCGRVSARPWDLGGPLFLVMPTLLGVKKTVI